jgi:hypothetical protein
MPLRVGLVVDTEFLRLVLRQLIRRMADIELVGEAAGPAEALASRHADALIIEVVPCATDPNGFAALCRVNPGRIVLIGDGDSVERAGLTIRRRDPGFNGQRDRKAGPVIARDAAGGSAAIARGTGAFPGDVAAGANAAR